MIERTELYATNDKICKEKVLSPYEGGRYQINQYTLLQLNQKCNMFNPRSLSEKIASNKSTFC